MYRKVLSRGASTCTRLASAPGDRGGLSLLPTASRIEVGFRDDGVCCGQVLRDEELAVIRVCGRERLANDQPGSRLVDRLLEVAHDEPANTGKRGAQQREREPSPSENNQTT